MVQPRVIRVESIRYDVLFGGFEGTAVRREANGVLTRRALRAPGDPSWTHDQARHALLCCIAG
ncbi:MAG: hypothetical protein AAF390_09090 [Pseudomonadota bacterium]